MPTTPEPQRRQLVNSLTTIVIDISLSPSALTSEALDKFECIGTGPRDTMVPSTITWTPIYGRLGTRRLGTAFLCISFVD
jgi:hypothetical protein